MYLGLDFGTSGARACAIGENQAVAWEHQLAYPHADGQTPADWRNALYELLGILPRHVAESLRGIALSATSATVLLCDGELNPLSPALLYHDSRAQAQAEQLRRIAPQAHIAGSTSSGLAKFLWLTQRPGSEQARYFLHQADWLTALLGGKPGTSDHHNALKTGYDVEALCWPDWIAALPRAGLLPEVLAPGATVGTILPELARRFAIDPQCSIHAGTTDSTAAFIATGVNEAGTGVTSLGSTLVIKQLSARRIEALEFGIYSHRFGDLWLVGGASNAGGAVLRQFFDVADIAALSTRIDPEHDSPLDYYPLPRPGERFPCNDPQLSPRLTPRPADDAQFLHGLLQGLAHIEAAGYARLAELGAPELIRVVSSGGGGQNETWRRIRERVLGVPVCRAEKTDAAYGSALLCASNAAQNTERGLPG
ncbi:MAG: FGGY-family carbohydrate kinase [Gallionella sp.]|nr:FGGY-family carbohydrate kinase [Gallionella sp.]